MLAFACMHATYYFRLPEKHMTYSIFQFQYICIPCLTSQITIVYKFLANRVFSAVLTFNAFFTMVSADLLPFSTHCSLPSDVRCLGEKSSIVRNGTEGNNQLTCDVKRLLGLIHKTNTNYNKFYFQIGKFVWRF